MKIRRILNKQLTDTQQKAFAHAADTQRGAPEQAMLDIQFMTGGGVYSYVVEHVGDITHRMMQKPGWNTNRGEEYVGDKTEKTLRTLEHGYGFEKEMMENFHNSFEFRKERGQKFGRHDDKDFDTADDFIKEIKRLGQKYAQEHQKVPVFNHPGWLAREAAITLGLFQFDKTRRHLRDLLKIVDSDDYAEQASKFQRNYTPY